MTVRSVDDNLIFTSGLDVVYHKFIVFAMKVSLKGSGSTCAIQSPGDRPGRTMRKKMERSVPFATLTPYMVGREDKRTMLASQKCSCRSFTISPEFF